MPFPSAPTQVSAATAFNPTTTAIPARLKPLIFDKKIIDWEASLFPTASIVMRDNKLTKGSPVWSYWQRKPFPHWMTVDTAYGVTDPAVLTTAITAAAMRIRSSPYDLWMCVRTKEVFQPYDTTLSTGGLATCYRGLGKYPAQALVVGDKLVKVGTAFKGGSLAPAAHSVLEEESLFYATHHQISVEATADVLGTRFVLDEDRFAAMTEARRLEFVDIMKRSFFGSGSTSTAGATTTEGINTVKGLIDHCNTWTYNFNGILTRPDFFGFVGDGPGRYIKGDIGIAMSSMGMNIVNNWLMEAGTAPMDKDIGSLGFNVDGLKLVAGRRAKIFYEAWLDEDPTTQGWFFVFPLNKAQGSAYVEVSGPQWDGRVRLDRDIKKEDGYLGRKDRWYAYYGWQHGPEIGYGFGYGIEG